MAGYGYLNLITEVETISNITGQRAMVRRLVNAGVAAICAAYDWPWLWTENFFPAIATYTTGTVSVTNGSATVTATGTAVFTAGMAGRKFRNGSESAYYIIASATASALTLQQLYQGTTATLQTYTIYKDVFRLAANLDKQKLIRQMQFGFTLSPRHISEFDVSVATPTSLGSSQFEMQVGKDERAAISIYTTGTVSASSSSRVLTGSGTLWTSVEGLGRGTKIQIGSLLITANTIDSDTQITVYEVFNSAVAAGTTYTILLDNQLVQLYTIPNIIENYFYRYQRMPAVLDADADYPDMPAPMHPMIIRWVLAWMWEHKGFIDRAAQSRTMFDADLLMAIKHYGSPHQDRIYRRFPRDIDASHNSAAGYPANVGVPLTR